MVEHHLLLPDVAVRRDLSDPVTISAVADAVRTPERLELLHRLTEADSIATGPSAWGAWKKALVDELVARVEHVLGGGDVADANLDALSGRRDAGVDGHRQASRSDRR